MRWAALYRHPPILRGVSASQIRADHAANQARIALTQVIKPTQQLSNERTGVFMFNFINAFLIGTASGLRALIGLAAISWPRTSGSHL